MRLLELRLLAYGAFTDLQLDFSRPAPALHLIYGPNEAGKSTTLRAILGLLYGIDERTSDAYLHRREQLRIGGRLRDAAGHELSCVRRKGKKDTLLGPNGKPIDEARLSRMLGGLPEAVFVGMFGLDHERLRKGGEQLRLGQGDLGESLFQAGLGARGIHEALGALDAEAGALFAPRGRRALNEALKSYEDARRRVRDHAKRAEGFRAQEQELEQAKARAAELHEQRRALLAEQSRLQRAQRVVPRLAKRAALLQRRAELGDVVPLPPGAEQERRRAQAALAHSETQAAWLQAAIDRLEKSRAGLRVVESLLGLSPEPVAEIRMRLGSQLKAEKDLPGRRAELRVLEQRALALLRSLGSEQPLEGVEQLRVDVQTQTRIRQLAHERSGLHERAQAAQREIEEADAAFEQARAELAALPALPGAGPPVLDAATLPSGSAVAELREGFERIEHRRGSQQQAQAKLEAREARVRLELGAMQREGPPPTEAELEAARTQRGELWQGVRTAISSAAAPEPTLLLQFEHEQRRADELADRLRRETRRVSELARLLSERDELERERAQLRMQADALAQEQAALARQWQQAWEPLRVRPRAPAEMQALLGRVAAQLEAGERGRAKAQHRQELARQTFARWQAQWSELMARLGLRADASVEEAQAVLEGLGRLFADVDGMRQLEQRIAKMERDAEQFERDVRGLVARHLPELGELEPARAAEELSRRCDEARTNLQQRERIDEELRSSRERLAALQAQAAEARRNLELLMHAAHVDDIDALEPAERRALEARAIEQELVEVEDELLRQGEGAGIEALIAETAVFDRDLIRVRLEDIADELERVHDEHATAVHRSGSLENGLELLKRDDVAAEAASEAEQHLSRVKAHAHGYVRKRLAAELLRREMRRYRDANQEPLVGRAAELFARMTLGRYPKLVVDYGEHDEPALVCVEAQGKAVKVEDSQRGRPRSALPRAAGRQHRALRCPGRADAAGARRCVDRVRR